MHEPITQVSQPSDLSTNPRNFYVWFNRVIGTVGMFIACLLVCHAAGMIHIGF